MWFKLYVLVLLIWTAKGAPIPPCPDGCNCKILEDSKQELTCTNVNFIDQQNHSSSIVALHLRNLNITKIDYRLSQLNELLELDLAHNSISNIRNIPTLPKLKSLNLNNNLIKDITAEYLPRTLSNIDISNNKINYIPKNFLDLKNLKSLYLKNNPISCTCDTIVVRDKLIASGVVFPDRVECYSPREHSGKTWQLVHCDTSENDLRDDMIGDVFASGEEGSGEVDKATTNLDDDDNKVYLPTSIDTNNSFNDDDEGSGDDGIFFTGNDATNAANENEGSGQDEIIVPMIKPKLDQAPKACYFNCSTPKPLVSNSTAKPPDIIGGVQIIIDDVFRPATENSHIIQEPRKGAVTTTTKSDSKLSDVGFVEKSDKNVKTKELEKQIEEPNTKMSTTFMIVVGLLALMICIVVYSVYKRRAQRKRRSRSNVKEPEGKELMPITKPTEPSPIKEKVPLLNGQNGANTATSNENNAIQQTQPTDNDVTDYPNDDEVELRSKDKDKDNLITPKMERVTIQAKELNAPKTPILINRQFNDDGSITTTPTN